MDSHKVAQFIRNLRKSKNMTQKELAEKLYVTDKAISKWERGVGCPDTSLLPLLAEALGVTTEEILNGHHIFTTNNSNFATNSLNRTEFEDTLSNSNTENYFQKRHVKIIIFVQVILGCIFGSFAILLTTIFMYTTSWEMVFTWEYLGEPISTLLFFGFIISFITGLLPLLLSYFWHRFSCSR